MKTIMQAWYDFLRVIIFDGKTHEKDDGDILQEHLINHCMIMNPLKQFGNQNITLEMYIDMLRKGVFDIPEYPIKGEALAQYVLALDDEEQIINKNSDGEDKFVYTYPERIFHMTEKNSDLVVNQFGIIIKRLLALRKEDDGTEYWSGSNRAVANIYNCAKDCDQKDIPCLNWIQCTIRDNKLILHVMFRSNDCFGAFPSNMFLLSYLGLKFTHFLRTTYPTLEFEGINYNSTSLHIYESDLPQAEKIVKNLDTD